jgi:hypothetical protein
MPLSRTAFMTVGSLPNTLPGVVSSEQAQMAVLLGAVSTQRLLKRNRNKREASFRGLTITHCLPRRLSWVRVPSPALPQAPPRRAASRRHGTQQGLRPPWESERNLSTFALFCLPRFPRCRVLHMCSQWHLGFLVCCTRPLVDGL